jgi:cytoskeletal protein RodZ
MKVPKENIFLKNKSSLLKDAFTDNDISNALHNESHSVKLTEKRKESLKRMVLGFRWFYLGIPAAAAAVLFLFIFQWNHEQQDFGMNPEQSSPIYSENNCNLDSLLCISDVAPKPQDSLQFISDLSIDLNSFPIILNSYYGSWQGCGGVIYQDNWWNAGMYGIGGDGFPQLQGVTFVDANAIAHNVDALVDSLPCTTDSIQVQDVNSTIQVANLEEYITVKSWLKSEWDNRTSFIKRAKIIWKKLRNNDEKEEDHIEIAYKGKSIKL